MSSDPTAAITMRLLGVIRTPFSDLEGMPIQPSGAAGVRGRVQVLPEYRPGLLDLEGFSHIILLYHFHRSQGFRLQVTPFLDDQVHGLFATRAPRRPNPIGLSIVKLLGVEGGELLVENIDVLDGTPLLDIKPYAPRFDAQEDCRTGWMEKSGNAVEHRRSDDRFKDDGADPA